MTAWYSVVHRTVSCCILARTSLQNLVRLKGKCVRISICPPCVFKASHAKASVGTNRTLSNSSSHAISFSSTLHPTHPTLLYVVALKSPSPAQVPTLPTVKSLSRGNQSQGDAASQSTVCLWGDVRMDRWMNEWKREAGFRGEVELRGMGEAEDRIKGWWKVWQGRMRGKGKWGRDGSGGVKWGGVRGSTGGDGRAAQEALIGPSIHGFITISYAV